MYWDVEAALSVLFHATSTDKDTHDDDYYQENDKHVPVMAQPVHVAVCVCVCVCVCVREYMYMYIHIMCIHRLCVFPAEES